MAIRDRTRTSVQPEDPANELALAIGIAPLEVLAAWLVSRVRRRFRSNTRFAGRETPLSCAAMGGTRIAFAAAWIVGVLGSRSVEADDQVDTIDKAGNLDLSYVVDGGAVPFI